MPKGKALLTWSPLGTPWVRIPSSRVPTVGANQALLEKSYRKITTHPLTDFYYCVNSLHKDLHPNTVNTSSCFRLSLPHLYNYIEAGSSYITPIWTLFCKRLHISNSQGLSAGGAWWQRWCRQHTGRLLTQRLMEVCGTYLAPGATRSRVAHQRQIAPWRNQCHWQTASPVVQMPQLSVFRIQIFPTLCQAAGGVSPWYRNRKDNYGLTAFLWLIHCCHFKGAQTWIPQAKLK